VNDTELLQRIRKGKLTHDERCDLVTAAKAALRRAGTRSTAFIWRGELLWYGPTTEGVYVIAEGRSSDESEWSMATRDPFTDLAPFPEYGDVKQMADDELMRRMAWSDTDDNVYRDELRRRHPRRGDIAPLK
jgi:hypothetical protein